MILRQFPSHWDTFSAYILTTDYKKPILKSHKTVEYELPRTWLLNFKDQFVGLQQSKLWMLDFSYKPGSPEFLASSELGWGAVLQPASSEMQLIKLKPQTMTERKWPLSPSTHCRGQQGGLCLTQRRKGGREERRKRKQWKQWRWREGKKALRAILETQSSLVRWGSWQNKGICTLSSVACSQLTHSSLPLEQNSNIPISGQHLQSHTPWDCHRNFQHCVPIPGRNPLQVVNRVSCLLDYGMRVSTVR